MKKIVILGSTGSIGKQALDVVAANPDKVQVVALTAGSNSALLAEQAKNFNVNKVAIADRDKADQLQELLPEAVVEAGPEAIKNMAQLPEADLVLNALVGFAGLQSSIAALNSDKILALANKESLVSAGHLLMSMAKPGQILPVDSEHSAAFQCLLGENPDNLEKLILTASGGPFRGWEEFRLRKVTPEMALAHPTWQMGPKITIDSATLMNKGLEVIEAHHMFNVPYEKIEVWIHPQSYIHAAAIFKDGSSKAQISPPDMRHPIQYALSYPERWTSDFPRARPAFDLEIHPCDISAYPALRLAYQAGKMGSSYPAVLSAANEVAVAGFLGRKIGFLDIIPIVRKTIEEHKPAADAPSIEQIEMADQWARQTAGELIEQGRT